MIICLERRVRIRIIISFISWGCQDHKTKSTNEKSWAISLHSILLLQGCLVEAALKLLGLYGTLFSHRNYFSCFQERSGLCSRQEMMMPLFILTLVGEAWEFIPFTSRRTREMASPGLFHSLVRLVCLSEANKSPTETGRNVGIL